jgi:hypothetical protein
LAGFGLGDSIFPMTAKEAIEQLRERSNTISQQVTAMHPIVPKLDNADAQNEIFRALFELTRAVEVVKKHLIKVEKQDNSTDL